MVNVNVLSEGFDAPHIDCVEMLRPTKSPGLIPAGGRGFAWPRGRPLPVLDYAGNVLEHGPVDAIRVRPGRGNKAASVQTAAAKECPRARPSSPRVIARAPTAAMCSRRASRVTFDRPVDAPVLSVRREPARHVVHLVKYDRHQKTGKAACACA